MSLTRTGFVRRVLLPPGRFVASSTTNHGSTGTSRSFWTGRRMLPWLEMMRMSIRKSNESWRGKFRRTKTVGKLQQGNAGAAVVQGTRGCVNKLNLVFFLTDLTQQQTSPTPYYQQMAVWHTVWWLVPPPPFLHFQSNRPARWDCSSQWQGPIRPGNQMTSTQG